MRARKLTELLNTSFKAGRKVLITGKPGIGKSDLVAAACQDLFDLHIFHPAVSDPTDYKGMPAVFQKDGMAVAEFLPFGDLTRLIQADRPTVAFIDDIGQSTPAVQAALMQLLLARRVNGHTISDHVVFCGATNDATHMAGVSGLIEPVKSRWHTIVELEVHLEDWCDWAIAAGQPTELIAFIRFRPELLSAFKPTRELKNTPCPRNVASVGEWLKLGVKDHEVIAGACGEGFAVELRGYLDMYATLPDLDEVILNPDSALTPDNPGGLYAVATGLASKCTTGNIERIIRYTDRIPKEYQVCTVRDMLKRDRTLSRTATMTKWLTKNSNVLN